MFWAGLAHKKKVVAITMIAIVVIALAISWWLFLGKYSSPNTSFAPTGQLVSGFPKELILDNTALISNSYTIGYAYNLNQYTANWTSSSSLDSLYASYAGYFASHGWTITNSSTDTPDFRGIYAVTSSTDANVVMASEPSGLDVTVSYVKK
jgi:ammonia channel protein AmtB